MNDATRSYRHLGAVILLGFVAVLSVLIFPSPPRHEVRASASFSIWLRAEQEGAAQLYYDLGGGFAERLSARVDLKPASTLSECTFPLLAGRLEGLRFDPLDRSASVTLARACIKSPAGDVVVAFSPDDFVASQQISRLEKHADELVVTPVDGGNDPALLLKLRTPLTLPAANSPDTSGFDRRIVAIQRWVGAGLLLIGLLVFWPIWRASKRATLSAPPLVWMELIGVGWAGFCVLYSRRPDVITCPQFWAEDGTIFFAQQHALGWKAALLTHGGYLHLLPRMTAGLAEFTSVRLAPAIYLWSALVAVMIAILKATSRRVGLPGAYWCALAVVLVPNMDEIAFNITNAQWFGAIVLLLVALSRPPATQIQLVADIAAVIVFGLSGPFSVFFLPLFAVRALRWRTPAVFATTLFLAATAGAQLIAYRNSPAPPSLGTAFDILHAGAALGYRTGGQLLNILPPPLVTNPLPWGSLGLLFWLALWIALPVAKEFRVTRRFLFAAAVLVLAGGLWRYRETVDVFFNRIHVQRYCHLPLVVTGWLLIAAIASNRARTVSTLLLILILVRNAPWYRVAPNIDYDWPRYAPAIQRGEPVDVPINPPGWMPHFPAKT